MAGRRQHVISLRGDIGWPPCLPDLTTCDFFLWGYLKTKVYEQCPLTLEPLKEAIQQEVAAIRPEMILKVMDNYRERLHQCINIQDRHLSDVLFKTHRCKTAFCVLSRNKKKNICRIFFGFEFISFPSRGILSAEPCTFCVQTNKHKQREYSTRTSCMRKQGPQHQGSRIRVEF